MKKILFGKCTLVVLGSWLVSMPVSAVSQGGNDIGNGAVVSNTKPKSFDELVGTVINYDNRSNYWTTGNPVTPAEGQSDDDLLKRIFAFYNVKTGKFLNLGGWWGLRSALGDSPYLFWVQRHSNKKITANQVVRYPLVQGETTVVPSLLTNMFATRYESPRRVGIGSRQGYESHATYTKLQVVDQKTGSVAYTIDTAKDTDGHFGTYHDLDLSKQRVEAEIDLSTCKDNNENILSIGSDIGSWGWGTAEKHAVADNVHIYYNATNTATKSLAAHELQVVYVGVRCNDPNGLKKSFYNVSATTPVKLSLTNKGLVVDVSASTTYYADEASTLTANGRIQVGSLEGRSRSYATYKKLQVEHADGTVDKIVPDGFVAKGALIGLAEGATYKSETDCGANLNFDLDNDKVVAVLDLSTCKNKAENVLSIGRAIGKWLDYNLHCYYTPSTGELQMNYTQANEFNQGTGRKTITLKDKTAPLYITMSKDGVSVSNGDASSTTLFSTLNIPFGYGPGNTLEVGNVEGSNRSNATYKRVTIGSEDVTDAFNNADKATGTVVSKVISPDTDKVEAELDLSTCTGTNENILSLGSKVSAWSFGTDSIGRLHLYYTAQSGKLTVWYVGNGQQVAFNQTVDKATPLTVSLAKATGLIINGVPYFGQLEIPYREGYAGEIVRYKNVKDNMPEINSQGNYVTDDNGSGIQRVYTNYIFADESRSGKRQTYFLTSNFTKSKGFAAGEENFFAYTNLESDKADYYSGVYGDRTVSDTGGMNSPVVSQWSIDPVADPTGRGQNLYTLSLTMPYDAEDPKGTALTQQKQFFLAPTQKYVYGPDGNKYYDSDTDETGSYPDPNDLEDVDLTSTLNDACYWKIISLYDHRQVMDNSDSELRHQVDASFLICDGNFTRENGVLTRWQSTVDASHLRIGYDGYYKTSPQDRDYTETAKGKADRYNHARYMAANIYNGGRGRLYQTLKIFTPGWYVVHCKGMTNVGAKLFVEYGGKRNTKVLTQVTDDDLQKLRSMDASVAKWPMDTDMPLYNSAVWMNDPYRKDADPTKYDNQVLLYVDSIGRENPGDLTIGVEVEQGADGVATTDEWTVFNDFSLLFGGASPAKEPYLILDEDKTSLDYIDRGVHPYVGKSLLLHRNFTLNKWNTFILPVSLTKEQFCGAFGEDSRLAELTSLTPTRVNFTSVDIKGAAADDVVLQAGEPYIIQPTKAAGTEDTTVATQEIWTWESNGAQSEKVTVGTPFYTILGVTLDGPKTTGDNEFEHYNFTEMSDYYADNIYVRSTEGVDGDGQGTMIMKGTYCKNFKGTQIIEGHASLNFTGNQYAYVMKDNVMKQLPQGQPYGTKGMRCWFEYKENAASQATPKVFIDGIGDEVTSIDEVDNDNPLTVGGRYASGVFNLNGQMVRQGAGTEGLPNGIYIVNGKKVMVRNNN